MILVNEWKRAEFPEDWRVASETIHMTSYARRLDYLLNNIITFAIKTDALISNCKTSWIFKTHTDYTEDIGYLPILSGVLQSHVLSPLTF